MSTSMDMAASAARLECAFCDRQFAYNAALAARVGKTVAFQSATSRIWAVCRRCGAWNLLPPEGDEHATLLRRLEARFDASPGHAAGDGVSLTKVDRTLTLLRLGEADRGSFAFWRYGPRFRRRRINWWVWTAAVSVLPGNYFAPMVSVPMMVVGLAAIAGIVLWSLRRTMLVARLSNGERLRMTERHIRRAAVRTSNSAWYLTVAHADGETVLSGPDAARVLGQLLTYFNYRGGSSEDVDRAVELVSRCQSPHAGEPLMNHALAYEVRGGLRKLQRHEALALEIAVHEDAESRAAQGELAAMQPVVRDAIERAEIYETLT